ncbi:uncharacterized protein LDX57_007108 [Aspergillus melleus]|uniref:uncharacterized protein n=1 Tax=Aspergillus melleus TaxID=138277 RepID=UPI001E8E50B4|nr:uncharacterized protein LDX57_007108 [Aspergillus melleus]KAH8429446.1 hypothetical protein LDX57_007108 [Aspergillus melleus]
MSATWTYHKQHDRSILLETPPRFLVAFFVITLALQWVGRYSLAKYIRSRYLGSMYACHLGLINVSHLWYTLFTPQALSHLFGPFYARSYHFLLCKLCIVLDIPP